MTHKSAVWKKQFFMSSYNNFLCIVYANRQNIFDAQ